MNNKKSWYQQKTTWAGVAIILTSVGEMVSNGSFDMTSFQNTLIGLGMIFGRQAIESVK